MSIAPVTSSSFSTVSGSTTKVASNPSDKFENVFSKLIKGANQNQVEADKSIQQLANGESDNLHDVVLSVAKADMSFRLLLEIRNRLIDSYQELMRMQV